jgi:[protein-PII] uridylyltransferase
MRDYFKAARDLYHLCNLTSRRIVEASDTSTHKKILSFIPSKLKFRQKIDGFFLEKKVLYAEQKNLFDEDPVQFLRAFRILQKHDTVFSPELENLILQKIDLVERKLLWINEAREMFLNMLRKKGKVGRILRLMHETGFLGKIIPEFEPLTCLVQHEFFHTYTADEHTLVCIEQLDRVLDSRDPQLKRYRELFVSCIQPEVLYLAILLHDVGKAANSKHHNEISAQLASRCARRLKLPINQLHTLVLWVDHHMTLHEFAQRRNLDDANTIHDFAKIVQTRDQLDGLMLMSYADSRGSSANQNWSSWKDLLVWTLYDQTVRMLQGEEEFTKQIHDEKMDILSRVRKQVGPEVSEGEFAIHFTLLPNRYALSVSDSLMAEHVKLVNQFLISQVVDGSDPLRPLIRWIDKPHEDHSEVIVVTWDRERLFSKIAGSFSLSGLNILSADVYTREDNVVIDTFRICTTRIDPTPNKVERREFEKILTQTLKDPLFDLHQELVSNRASKQTDNEDRIDFPSRIAFDNQTSPDCTLLHLETPDYMGLLHDVTDCLANHKISIQYSRITTEKGAALDTFYLTDPDNNKLEDKEKLNQLLVELKQILIAQTHP